MNWEFIVSLPDVATYPLRVLHPVVETVLQGTYHQASAQIDLEWQSVLTSPSYFTATPLKVYLADTSSKANKSALLRSSPSSAGKISEKVATYHNNNDSYGARSKTSTVAEGELYCVPCRKKFGSVATLKTHEGSAKHKKEAAKAAKKPSKNVSQNASTVEVAKPSSQASSRVAIASTQPGPAAMGVRTSDDTTNTEKLSELVYLHEQAKLAFRSAFGEVTRTPGPASRASAGNGQPVLRRITGLHRGLSLFWKVANEYLHLHHVRASVECLNMCVLGVIALKQLDEDRAPHGKHMPASHRQSSGSATLATATATSLSLAQSAPPSTRTEAKRMHAKDTSGTPPIHTQGVTTHAAAQGQTTMENAEMWQGVEDDMVIVSASHTRHTRVYREALLYLARAIRPYSHTDSSECYLLHLEATMGMGREVLLGLCGLYTHRDALVRECAMCITGTGSVHYDGGSEREVHARSGVEVTALSSLLKEIAGHVCSRTASPLGVVMATLVFVLNGGAPNYNTTTLKPHATSRKNPATTKQPHIATGGSHITPQKHPGCTCVDMLWALKTGAALYAALHESRLGAWCALEWAVLARSHTNRDLSVPSTASTGASHEVSERSVDKNDGAGVESSAINRWSKAAARPNKGPVPWPDAEILRMARTGFRSALALRDVGLCIAFEQLVQTFGCDLRVCRGAYGCACRIGSEGLHPMNAAVEQGTAVSGMCTCSTPGRALASDVEARAHVSMLHEHAMAACDDSVCVCDDGHAGTKYSACRYSERVDDISEWLDLETDADASVSILESGTKAVPHTPVYGENRSTHFSKDRCRSNCGPDLWHNDASVSLGEDLSQVMGELGCMQQLSVAGRTKHWEWFDDAMREELRRSCSSGDESLMGLFDLYRRGDLRTPFPGV